jgi:hypothetical protein
MSTSNKNLIGLRTAYTSPEVNKKFALEYFEVIDLTDI